MVAEFWFPLRMVRGRNALILTKSKIMIDYLMVLEFSRLVIGNWNRNPFQTLSTVFRIWQPLPSHIKMTDVRNL